MKLSRRASLAVAGIVGLGTLGVGLASIDTSTQVTATPVVWAPVVNDTFDTSPYPAHWAAYTGRYSVGNCARASHDTVSGGYLHLKLSYEATGSCGPGWYSGGLTLDKGLSALNQRVTVRFRIVSTGGVYGHRVIPMLNPDDGSHIGEWDLCESSPYSYCSTFLHYGAKGTYQTRKKYALDMTQWHTMMYTSVGFVHSTSIDGVVVWAFTGDATTLPAKLRHVVLHQQCDKYGCPTNQAGSEDIQIDSILVENG